MPQQILDAKVGPGGRVVIPAAFRRTLGLKTGDAIVFILDDAGLRLKTRQQELRELQEMVCRVIPPDIRLAEELIAERRAEAARE